MGDQMEMLKLLRILATMKDGDDDCEGFSDTEEEGEGAKIGNEFIDESFPPEFILSQKGTSNVGKIVNPVHQFIFFPLWMGGLSPFHPLHVYLL